MSRPAFAITPLWALMVLLAASAHADSDLRELYLSPKAQGMGGASVAISEDEDSVWLNPAGLAGVKRTTFNYAPVTVEVSGDAIGQLSNTAAFNNLSVGTLNNLMGKNTYARIQVAPSLTMPNFGMAVLADVQGAVLAKNISLPQVEVGYQDTYGIQFAYGTSITFGRGRRSRARRGNSSAAGTGELRIGIAAKIMERRGGYHLLSFSQLLDVSQEEMQELTGDYGIGYGIDVGTQYVYTVNERVTLSAGAVIDNVGTMAFASAADPQSQFVNLGLGAKYQLPTFAVRFAYDYRDAFAAADWRKKTHFGISFEIPLVSLYVGMSQMSPAGGLTFDIWIAQITACIYNEQIGATLGDDSERRYLLQAALKF